MPRKKKIIEEVKLETPIEVEETFMNPPVEEIEEPKIEETIRNPIEEPKQEQKSLGRPLKKVLKFTPLGPRVEYY